MEVGFFPESETEFGQSMTPPRERKTVKKKRVFFCCLLIVNIIVIILVGVLLGMHTHNECQPTTEISGYMTSLCVTKSHVGSPKGMEEQCDERSDENACCFEEDRLEDFLEKIYLHVRDTKLKNYTAYPKSDSESNDTREDLKETIWNSNQMKPCCHLTGVNLANYTDKIRRSDTDDRGLHVVADWPRQILPYRSVMNGFVEGYTWGASVSIEGLYSVHSFVNFFFNQNITIKNGGSLVHQLCRFRARDGVAMVLTERNQTVPLNYRDGLHSSLITLATLDAGDVIFVTVSHMDAMNMQNGWHTIGLVLME